AVVCDGTNADDLREHRPGYAAGQAAGVRSPLAEAGLTKPDVRRAAHELGLPVWDAPAAPCLSSRVAYGIPITSQRLAQVERAEAYLRELGVTGDLRVRHHVDRGAASIEVEPRWVPWVTERLTAGRGRGQWRAVALRGVAASRRRARAWCLRVPLEARRDGVTVRDEGPLLCSAGALGEGLWLDRLRSGVIERLRRRAPTRRRRRP